MNVAVAEMREEKCIGMYWKGLSNQRDQHPMQIKQLWNTR